MIARRAAWLAAACLACGRPEPPPPARAVDANAKGAHAAPTPEHAVPEPVAAIAPSASATAVSGSAAQDYTVAGIRVHVRVESGVCFLSREDVSNSERKLDLQPPCYVVTWQGEPARDTTRAQSVPIGTLGEPMAYRYADLHGAIAIALIGDPIEPSPDQLQPDSMYSLRMKQGARCGASVQGVLLSGDELRVVQERSVGLACVEAQVDPASFWLAAHNGK